MQSQNSVFALKISVASLQNKFRKSINERKNEKSQASDEGMKHLK
jgi:hypothetical protein